MFSCLQGPSAGAQIDVGVPAVPLSGRPLLQSYRAGHFGFDTFSESYCGQLDEAYLHDPGLKQWVEQELPHLGDATLLCFERQGEPCHRLVLARWLKGKQPTLELGELR